LLGHGLGIGVVDADFVGDSVERHDRAVTEIEAAYDVVTLGQLRLRTVTYGDGRPEIVMLHDGLGSIPQWRSVPAGVAAATGATVLAYERAGHGASTPVPDGPWPTDWLHQEAEVFDRFLDELGIDDAFVVGHSDGGSIALIHAATAGGGGTMRKARGVLAIAPHSWVEDICHESIVGMRAARQPIETGLARHHAAPEAVFEAWSGVWVSEAFRSWDIRPMLSAIDVPTVIAQGAEDAYATEDQAVLTAEAVGPNGSWRLLDGLGHIAHHDDADAIVALIADVFASLADGSGGSQSA